jgi:hypothetical protein
MLGAFIKVASVTYKQIQNLLERQLVEHITHEKKVPEWNASMLAIAMLIGSRKGSGKSQGAERAL